MRTRVPLLVALLMPTAVVPAHADTLAFQSAPPTLRRNAPTAAAEGLPTTAEFLKDQREMLEQYKRQYPAAAARRVDEVVRLVYEGGHLTVQFLANDVPEPASVPVRDAEGIMVFTRPSLQMGGAPEMKFLNLQVLIIDAKAPRATLVDIQTDTRGTNLSVAEQTPLTTGTSQLLDFPRSSVYSEDPPVCTLRFDQMSETGEGESGKFDVSRESFGQLLDARHDEVVATAGAAFMTLRSMHALAGVDASQASQLFRMDDPIDPQVEKRLDVLLAELTRGGTAVADDVRRQLKEAGDATIVALARRSREGWSVDLAVNVDALMADLLPLSARQARKVLDSPTRLVDVLYWPDESIRRSALKRLERITGKAIERIDPAVDPYSIAPQIEALRVAVRERR